MIFVDGHWEDFHNYVIGKLFMVKASFSKTLIRAILYRITPPIQWNLTAAPLPYSHFLFYSAPKEVVRVTLFHRQMTTSLVIWRKSLYLCFLTCIMVVIIPTALWLNERVHKKYSDGFKSSKCSKCETMSVNDAQFSRKKLSSISRHGLKCFFPLVWLI